MNGQLALPKPSIIVYDNGGRSYDRYTVIYDDSVFAMAEDSTGPLGFNQYCGERDEFPANMNHCGRRLKNIPAAVMKGFKRA